MGNLIEEIIADPFTSDKGIQSTIYLQDCIEGMKQYPDNYFDLAVVDPPYGIGEDGRKSKGRTTRKDGTIRNGVDKRNGLPIKRMTSKYHIKEWDKEIPSIDYFNELKRISKNQIIFGANHFIENINHSNSTSWIVWDKLNGLSDFSDCELAWTSFKKGVRKFTFMWNGMLQGSISDGSKSEGNKSKCEKRIHPTQKPVALYDWIFKNYASPGQKIIDTHLGSGSSRIAAHKAGLDFTGFELDEDYFKASQKRFMNHVAQKTLF